MEGREEDRELEAITEGHLYHQGVRIAASVIQQMEGGTLGYQMGWLYRPRYFTS